MAFCKHCGAEINEGAAFCPKCGASLNPAPEQDLSQNQFPNQNQYQYQNQNQYQYQNPNQNQYNSQPPVVDSGSIGWGVLGFCIPIVGLILFLVWKDQKPRTAKVAGIGALISVVVGILWYVLVIGVGMMAYMA